MDESPVVRIDTYRPNTPSGEYPFYVDARARPFIIFAAMAAAFFPFGL